MRNILSLFLVLIFSCSQAQELNCTVTVNAQKLPNANQSVFKTLETALNEFVNRTQWTSQTF